jgi:hypothetical protein
MKSIEMHKRNCELLQEQNNELQNEKQKVVYQLQSLFVLYNKQKAAIERLGSAKGIAETERKSYKERLEDLEREKKRARMEQSKESEKAIGRYKSMAEEMEQKVQILEKRLTSTEGANHSLTLSEKDLKEQVKRKEKDLLEAEYTLEMAKSRLEGEIELLIKQKEQLKQINQTLEKKLELVQRENERQTDEIQRMHKELVKLTYSNEELGDEVRRLRRRCNIPQEAEEETYDLPNTQRLAAIEKKLETILRHQNKPEESIEESQNEEGENFERVLKDLTAQILDKEELQNENIIRLFKLDQIQLEDKESEYKNLLRAMAALYFSNRYIKMIQPLFNIWREKFQEKFKETEEVKTLTMNKEEEKQFSEENMEDKRDVIKTLNADEDWERELESNEREELVPTFEDIRGYKKARSDQDIRDYQNIEDEFMDKDFEQY